MTQPPERVPQFEAEFACSCGNLITVRVARARVEAEPGVERTCRVCKQRYRVTTEGAQPIRDAVVDESKIGAVLGYAAWGLLKANETAVVDVPPRWALRLPQAKGKSDD
jgi:hypothetical protein